jgi:hypothetical protein
MHSLVFLAEYFALIQYIVIYKAAFYLRVLSTLLLKADALLQRGICGGQSGAGISFSPNTFGYCLVTLYSTSALYVLICHPGSGKSTECRL